MALSTTCLAYPHISSPKIRRHCPVHIHRQKVGSNSASGLYLHRLDAQFSGQRGWSFVGGSRITIKPKIDNVTLSRKTCGVCYSWLANSQIASGVFTLGTAAVLPFYTLMVVAPRAELTKKTMNSSVPYVVLGLLYTCLLYLSWTPDTIRLMFASKYWLPELQGMVKMFSSEMTLASAWIHLLVVDLYAARQVYYDGLESEIETRHSVSLCLLFCPIGIVSHLITKTLSRGAEKTRHS